MTNVYKKRRIDEPPKINVNLLNEEIFDQLRTFVFFLNFIFYDVNKSCI